MTTNISRNSDGVVEFCMREAEEIKDREDLDIDKRMKHTMACLNMALQWCKLNLENKKLVMKAPEIAKNRALVLQLGPPQLAEVEDEAAQKKAAAK